METAIKIILIIAFFVISMIVRANKGKKEEKKPANNGENAQAGAKPLNDLDALVKNMEARKKYKKTTTEVKEKKDDLHSIEHEKLETIYKEKDFEEYNQDGQSDKNDFEFDLKSAILNITILQRKRKK